MSPDDFRSWPDLAGRPLGGSVVHTNDEFYADVHSLIAAEPATHDPGAYGPRGKVYDGWETRRRRDAGEDFVIVRLAAPGVIHGVVIDTSHFRGNYPPLASVHATTVLGYPSVAELLAATWRPLAEKVELDGDTPNLVEIEFRDRLCTHLKLTIHPDGGVARLRVHGEVIPDPRLLGGRPDLAATTAGGRVVGCSDMFFGAPANALAPGRARVMSDGWETARRRGNGHDWLEVQLAAPALPHDVEIDTSRFVGNAPGWADVLDADTGATLVERVALLPDTLHRFRATPSGPVARVRLNIYPDGGVSRFRVHGTVAPAARDAIAQRWLDLLGPEIAGTVDPALFYD